MESLLEEWREAEGGLTWAEAATTALQPPPSTPTPIHTALATLIRARRPAVVRDILFRVLRSPLGDKDPDFASWYEWAVLAADDAAAHHQAVPAHFPPNMTDLSTHYATLASRSTTDIPDLVTTLLNDGAILRGHLGGIDSDALLPPPASVLYFPTPTPVVQIVGAPCLPDNESEETSSVQELVRFVRTCLASLPPPFSSVQIAPPVDSPFAIPLYLQSPPLPSMESMLDLLAPLSLMPPSRPIMELTPDHVLGSVGSGAATAHAVLTSDELAESLDLEEIVAWIAVYFGIVPSRDNSHLALLDAASRITPLSGHQLLEPDANDPETWSHLARSVLLDAFQSSMPSPATTTPPQTLDIGRELEEQLTAALYDSCSSSIQAHTEEHLPHTAGHFVSLRCVPGVRALHSDCVANESSGGVMSTIGPGQLTWVGPVTPEAAGALLGSVLPAEILGDLLFSRAEYALFHDVVALVSSEVDPNLSESTLFFLSVIEIGKGTPQSRLAMELLTGRPAHVSQLDTLGLNPRPFPMSPILWQHIDELDSLLEDAFPSPQAPANAVEAVEVLVSQLQSIGHLFSEPLWADLDLEPGFLSALPPRWIGLLFVRVARLLTSSRPSSLLDARVAECYRIAAEDADAAPGCATFAQILARFGPFHVGTTPSAFAEDPSSGRDELDASVSLTGLYEQFGLLSEFAPSALATLVAIEAGDESSSLQSALQEAQKAHSPGPALVRHMLNSGWGSEWARCAGPASYLKTVAAAGVGGWVQSLTLSGLECLDVSFLAKVLKAAPRVKSLSIRECPGLEALPELSSLTPDLSVLEVVGCPAFVTLEPHKRTRGAVFRRKQNKVSGMGTPLDHETLSVLILEDLPVLGSLQFSLPSLQYLRVVGTRALVRGGCADVVFCSFSQLHPLVLDVSGWGSLTDRELALFFMALHSSQPRRSEMDASTRVVAWPGCLSLSPIIAKFPSLVLSSVLGANAMGPGPNLSLTEWESGLPSPAELEKANVDFPAELQLDLDHTPLGMGGWAVVQALVDRGTTRLALSGAAMNALAGASIVSGLEGITVDGGDINASLLLALCESNASSLLSLRCPSLSLEHPSPVSVLGSGVIALPLLRELNLSGTSLPPGWASGLVASSETGVCWPCLTTLNLAATTLTPDDAAHLAASFGMADPLCVKDINISCNDLDGPSVAAVVGSLTTSAGSLIVNASAVGLSCEGVVSHVIPAITALVSHTSATIHILLASAKDGNDDDGGLEEALSSLPSSVTVLI